MKNFKGALEKFAKVMVQPLMYLSVAGLLMVFGVLFTNDTVKGLLPFLNWYPIQLIANLIYNAIFALINNLSVVFAVGIAAALAKKDKHQAAIIGLLSYLMYLTVSKTVLEMSGNLAVADPMFGLMGTGQSEILGIQNVDMNVFGGIIVGFLTGYVFNKTCNKRFKGAMQIYSGPNFSFAVMIFVMIGFGLVSTYLWPYAQQAISALTTYIKNSGEFGLFLYGFLDRLLLPTGLHHLVYMPFMFTDVGGVLQLGDTTIAGAYPIMATEIQMGVEQFSSSIYYMANGFTKMFGYIGIGAAFIFTAKKENKAKTKALLIPLIVTACVASITEPIDFMFAFVAPLLYLVHSIIAGLFIALLSIFEVTAVSGNLITSSITNVVLGAELTNYPMFFLLGAIQIVLYFVVFTALIKIFKFKTPGREDDTNVTENKEEKTTTVDIKEEDIKTLVEGLGGKANINSVENCFTRLRVNVKDVSLLDDNKINTVKNSGIVKKDNDIQVIIGLQVSDVRAAVETVLNKGE